jgi:hypothetical protein
LVFFVAVFFVPKINIQIGTEQELEEVDVKYFGMASVRKVGVCIFGNADYVINSDCHRIRNLKVWN